MTFTHLPLDQTGMTADEARAWAAELNEATGRLSAVVVLAQSDHPTLAIEADLADMVVGLTEPVCPDCPVRSGTLMPDRPCCRRLDQWSTITSVPPVLSVVDAPVDEQRVNDTREQWLQRLVTELRPWYGNELPETIHISVGFPSSGVRSKAIGECWKGVASADKAPHVFIHPKIDDANRVGDIVVHELIHACRPDAKHGPQFKELAVRLGLKGRMTATTASEELQAKLAEVIEKIGPYPHPALASGQTTIIGGKPTQTTRMIKVECPADGYTVRTTRKWIEVGMPTCPCGETMAVAS